MVAVSVLVTTHDPGPDLLALVRSVDAQTLRAAEFELVVVDASTDGSAERLQELARRRPNVRVLAAAGGGEAERLALARAHASGAHELVLSQHRRLAPRALELLLARGRTAGADVVLGRVAGAAASRGEPLRDDADRIDPAAIDAAACIALVRRDVAQEPFDELVVAAEGRYACAVAAADPSDPDAGIAVASAGIRWEAGALHLDARLDPVRAEVLAWLVAAQDPVDVVVPPAVTAAGAVAAVLDPRTAEAGGPLGDGLWDLRLRLSWPGGGTTLPLPTGPAVAAIVDGRPFVVRAGDGGPQLDVGATLGDVTGPAPSSTATIVESAHGILLTLDQPDLHVHGDAELDARLLLDRFVLRARLVCRGGAARVEAFASSLAGVSTIALAVGGGTPVQTGLRLRVDGVGSMRVEPVPVPAAAPVPVASEPAGAPPLVQRLRRRAPRVLEPTVRRLSRVPVLRRAYRLLLTR